MCFSFTFNWPPNIGTFQGPPNIGAFQGPPNIGAFQRPPNIKTFHWPPSWDLPSPPSFSFSLKGRIRIIGSSPFWKTILDSNLEKYLFPQPFLVGNEWLLLVDGTKKDSRMDVYSTFERMEVSIDSVGSLKS
jgi:hypothetical protein